MSRRPPPDPDLAGLTPGQAEIFVPDQPPVPDEWITARDQLEDGPADARLRIVYAAWCAHDPDPRNPCKRDPVADPHEDLAYIGKTKRGVFTRWPEHLVGTRPDGKPNNSAIYRHRRELTGLSIVASGFRTDEALDAAEDDAIKTLWPRWNVTQTDPRNPYAPASRSTRKPDRLAPLIGWAQTGWALAWVLQTAAAFTLLMWAHAVWWLYLVEAVAVVYLSSRAQARTKTKKAARRIRQARKNRR